jgi:chromosome segregation ATPase
MDAKFDAYEGFDPTQTEGGGCSCEGGVYWDMVTQTWKQGKVATPKTGADCSQVEAALKQAQADKAKADEKAAKAEQAKEAAETEAETARLLAANANVAKDQAERDKEAAQESEATAIAKAEKAKEDLNVALAELVTKQNELTAKDTEIAELKRKLEECQKDKCPEVDVVSLGDETVFSGNSCDEVVGLGAPRRAEPDDHL